MESHGDFLKNLEETENGHFLLENQGGRAILRVFRPGRQGRSVKIADVLARLELFGITDYDAEYIKEIISLADGKPADIAAWREPESVDATVSVRVADDEMSASLTISSPRHGGAWPSSQSILDALTKAGVVYGIKGDLIQRIADRLDEELQRKGPWKQTYTIAEGQFPTRGNDARIKFYFEVNPRAVPEAESDYARVDFRKLHVIQTCRKDDVLCEILDATPGEPGRTVTGKILDPADPDHAILQAGRNTTIIDDGKKLLSSIDGHVRIQTDPDQLRGRVDVEEVLELQMVDYSTGHVNFPGTVVVNGAVLDGFQIEAEGDILIEKTVGNVHLKAGGDILLTGGATGRGATYLEAGRDIYARFVQNAALAATGSIYIEEASMHSRLSAAGEIAIDTGRGELIGGKSLCGHYLRVRKLGSKVETSTQITIGVDPKTFGRLKELEAEFEERKKTLERVRLHIQQIEESKKRGKEISEDDENTYERLLLIRTKFEKFLNSLESQRDSVLSTIKPDPKAVIEVLESVYPGVEISFGIGIQKYRVERKPIFLPSRFQVSEGQILLTHT